MTLNRLGRFPIPTGIRIPIPNRTRIKKETTKLAKLIQYQKGLINKNPNRSSSIINPK